MKMPKKVVIYKFYLKCDKCTFYELFMHLIQLIKVIN